MKKFAVILAMIAIGSTLIPAHAKKRADNRGPVGPVPLALLDGGRRLDFVRSLSSEQELNEKRSFFNRLVDIVAGAPQWHRIVRPYAIVTDSRGRLLITDPGASVVHIFDLEKKKYTSIEGGKKDSFHSPIGIAVDRDDNIYVTDSQLGKIFVFDARGKFRRMIGDIKGEGFFKRPTGIACDKAAGRLYVTDTLRNRIFVTDLNGTVLSYFGSRGSEPGQFNFPTEVMLHGDDIFVVDAMNFRVQMFDSTGKFRAQFGSAGDSAGTMFRTKGVAVDSEGHVYLVDAAREAVQAFNREGQLLFTFGRSGSGIGEFQLPSGVWIDPQNRIYVADSYNHRIQIFQFVNGTKASGGQQ